MTPMLRLFSISLVIWTILLGQATSFISLAEALHEAGHHSHYSSTDTEQHQNGECQSQSLLHQCAVAAVTTLFTTSFVPAATTYVAPPFSAFHSLFKQQQTICAPPKLLNKTTISLT